MKSGDFYLGDCFINMGIFLSGIGDFKNLGIFIPGDSEFLFGDWGFLENLRILIPGFFFGMEIFMPGNREFLKVKILILRIFLGMGIFFRWVGYPTKKPPLFRESQFKTSYVTFI